jgi:hypothetical protein
MNKTDYYVVYEWAPPKPCPCCGNLNGPSGWWKYEHWKEDGKWMGLKTWVTKQLKEELDRQDAQLQERHDSWQSLLKNWVGKVMYATPKS